MSVHELRGCGLSDGAIATRVRNGRLHPWHRGVYAVGHRRLPAEGVWLAAVKACGHEADLSHFAAAALFGFTEWDDRYPEVTVRSAARRSHPGLIVHRTKTLDPVDRTRERGIPVTAPARTLLDLAAILPPNRSDAP